MLVPGPETPGPPARLVHATHDDVLTTDVADQLQGPVDQHPPVVSVLALLEERRARLDGDLGARVERACRAARR